VKLAALVLALAACSVTHRSGEFACTSTADCNSDRVCDQGYCVIPGDDIDGGAQDGTHVDARPSDGPPHADAPPPQCPALCDMCDDSSMTCTIECGPQSSGGGKCFQPMTCPTGWNCDFECTGNSVCHAAIDCTNSASCTLECSGSDSCRDVTCGSGACTADCSGEGSCRSFDCSTSCACQVDCGFSASCQNVTCGTSTSGFACENGPDGYDCSTAWPGCNSCQ
jgi:hypothetical protein